MELLPQPFGPRTKLNRPSSSFVTTWERKFFKHTVEIRMRFLQKEEVLIPGYWEVCVAANL
jgi:hypothetical protein